MIKNNILLLVIFGLLSCANPTHYQPAVSDINGYTESEVSATSYKITFVGNSDTRIEMVNDLALLRAAELTLQHGYQYLTIVEQQSEIRETEKNYLAMRASTVKHTLYKENGIEMCEIEKNGTIEKIKMTDMQDVDMKTQHNRNEGNSYYTTEYEQYPVNLKIKNPQTQLIIEFVDGSQKSKMAVDRATNIIEKMTTKYQIELKI